MDIRVGLFIVSMDHEDCQTYKVWTQVSFDFLLTFFSLLLSFILGIGVRVFM